MVRSPHGSQNDPQLYGNEVEDLTPIGKWSDHLGVEDLTPYGKWSDHPVEVEDLTPTSLIGSKPAYFTATHPGATSDSWQHSTPSALSAQHRLVQHTVAVCYPMLSFDAASAHCPATHSGAVFDVQLTSQHAARHQAISPGVTLNDPMPLQCNATGVHCPQHTLLRYSTPCNDQYSRNQHYTMRSALERPIAFPCYSLATHHPYTVPRHTLK